MSEETFKPLPLFEKVGVTFGLRAALMFPRGAEESVMLAVVAAAEVDRERGDSRGVSMGPSGIGEEDGILGECLWERVLVGRSRTRGHTA
jgi:hypothetical protein